MKERFDNPPLVELVAELRWRDVSLPPGLPQGLPFPPFQEAFEKQLPAMSSALAGKGYGASERLIPVGFPVPPETPIIRYRYSGGEAESQRNSIMFQLGAGLFTVNAVQPYKSWDEFSPVVADGVKVLLETQKNNIEGYSLLLRYFDAFEENLTGELSHIDFITRVFGFTFEAPGFLKKHSTTGVVAVPTLQTSIPLGFGNLQMQMVQGEIQGRPAYILENVVAIDGLASANVDEILGKFSEARNIIHDVFINLTASIRDKMKPVAESK